MPSYVELIREDVVRHDSYDTSLWPSNVSQFAQSLQNELRLPSWLKPDDEGRSDLLPRLCMPDDPDNHPRDSFNGVADCETEQRVHTVLNTVLADCARIQAVLETETLTDTLYPKESFLVILVRNVMLRAHEQLSTLEDAPVVLPRHSNGQEIPLLNFVKKAIYAPLIVSVSQEMPVTQDGSELEEPLGDEEESCDVESISFREVTMSEFCTPQVVVEEEEEEEEEKEALLPPLFEAHFIAYPPSATPPALCNIPVLCMADAEQLPVLFASLLYQRRVWHISDPLLGVQFSKYDTTIRLYVGWLEDDDYSSSVFGLPRAHLGEISTPIVLDFSSPSAVLAVSRLLCSLESHLRDVRDTASRSVGAVISGMQSDPSLSWRIDTDFLNEDSDLIPENNSTRDKIIRWLKTHSFSAGEDVMQTRRRAKKSSPATSSSTPHDSSSDRFVLQSSRLPPSAYTPPTEHSLVALSKTSNAQTQTQKSQSCSKFAATDRDASVVFRWIEMIALIWPETWNSPEDLPPFDLAVKPSVEKLLDSIAELKGSNRLGAVRCIPVKDFVNLRILENSFSAIFQASRKSYEKTLDGLSEEICEAAWRHDHDRLLFDFFIRLLQPKEGHTLESLLDDHPIVKLEDPLSRPSLETTLRLPKSEDRQTRQQQMLFRAALRSEAKGLEEWLDSRKGPPLHTELGHALHADIMWYSWMVITSEESELERITALKGDPLTGICDALGRLRVELPDVPLAAVRNFQLVVRTGKAPGEKKVQESKEAKATSTRSQSKPASQSSSVSGGALLDATASSSTKKHTEVIPIPYMIPSSSAPTSIDTGTMDSSDIMNELPPKVEGLHLNQADGTASGAFLELPILAAVYKKVDGDLIKGTNQLRMYLTSAVKFLEKIGITNFPVYGVQTNGSTVCLPAAILRDDNYIHLYERLTEKLDISTPVGAWHYATILCRIAQKNSDILKKRFELVKEDLVASLKVGRSDELKSWTMEHQREEWEKAGLIPKKSQVKKAAT